MSSRGGLVAVPTETFYGLAADPTNPLGVERVYAFKRRGAGQALPVLIGAREQLEALGVAAEPRSLDRFFGIWPAALTVVFPLRSPIPASAGALSLAVRLPAHDGLRTLLARIGPLTGTSLNRSGQAPCEEPAEVERLFSAEIDVLVDGGRTPGGSATTLVDATVEPPRVLRAGAFAWP